MALLVLTGISASVHAQSNAHQATQSQNTSLKKHEYTQQQPLFNGINVGVDLWGLASKVLSSDMYWAEVMVNANLKNRYFPTLEIGYAKSGTTDEQGAIFSAAAPYAKIGIDYNFLHNKQHGNMLLGVLRYGFSSYSYDADYATGPDASQRLSFKDQDANIHWFELGLGIRAHIAGPISMGWSVRLKHRLSESAHADKMPYPYHAPGFGRNKSNALGFCYSIIYKLPTRF